MSWCISLAAWSALIILLEIDSIDDNNNDNALLQKWQVNNDGSLLQKWQVDDDKLDNNKDKVYLLLKRWVWWVMC